MLVALVLVTACVLSFRGNGICFFFGEWWLVRFALVLVLSCVLRFRSSGAVFLVSVHYGCHLRLCRSDVVAVSSCLFDQVGGS